MAKGCEYGEQPKRIDLASVKNIMGRLSKVLELQRGETRAAAGRALPSLSLLPN